MSTCRSHLYGACSDSDCSLNDEQFEHIEHESPDAKPTNNTSTLICTFDSCRAYSIDNKVGCKHHVCLNPDCDGSGVTRSTEIFCGCITKCTFGDCEEILASYKFNRSEPDPDRCPTHKRHCAHDECFADRFSDETKGCVDHVCNDAYCPDVISNDINALCDNCFKVKFCVHEDCKDKPCNIRSSINWNRCDKHFLVRCNYCKELNILIDTEYDKYKICQSCCCSEKGCYSTVYTNGKCMTHVVGFCVIDNCKRSTSDSDNNRICYMHLCIEKKCTNVRKDNGSSYCDNHICKANNSCRSRHTENSPFCKYHKCELLDCMNRTTNRTKRCKDHICHGTYMAWVLIKPKFGRINSYSQKQHVMCMEPVDIPNTKCGRCAK